MITGNRRATNGKRIRVYVEPEENRWNMKWEQIKTVTKLMILYGKTEEKKNYLRI